MHDSINIMLYINAIHDSINFLREYQALAKSDTRRFVL